MGLAGAALVDGRPITALAELASGLVSQVPGVGTAASFGIDAFIASFDEKDKAAKEAEGSAGYNKTIEQKAVNEYNERMGVQQLLTQKSPGNQQSTMGSSFRPNIKSYPTANVPTNNIAKQTTLAHEGIVQTPYKDAGGWSIGAGHYSNVLSSLPDFLSTNEAKTLYDKDYDKHKNIAARMPEFGQLDSVRQGALIDMTYNMGSVADWSTMRRNLSTGNFEEASRNVLQSKYASQVPQRAQENSKLIATGDPSYFNYRDANVYERQGGRITDTVKYYHQGGMVYGEPGSEHKAILKAGEYVVSADEVEKSVLESFKKGSNASSMSRNPELYKKSLDEFINKEASIKTKLQYTITNIKESGTNLTGQLSGSILGKVKIFNEKSKKLVEYSINEYGQLFDKGNILATYKINKDGQLYSTLTNEIVPLIKTKGNDIVALSKDMSNTTSAYYSALYKDLGPVIQSYASELKNTGKLKISEGVNFAKNIDYADVADKAKSSVTNIATNTTDFAKSSFNDILASGKDIQTKYNEHYSDKKNKSFTLTNKIKNLITENNLTAGSGSHGFEKGLYISQELIRNYEKGYKSERLKQITDIKFNENLKKYSSSESVVKGLTAGYDLFKQSSYNDNPDISTEVQSYAKNYSSVKDSKTGQSIYQSDLANMQTSKDVLNQENVNTQNELLSENTNAIKDNIKTTNNGLNNLNTNLNNVSSSINSSNKTMITIHNESKNKNSGGDGAMMDSLANAGGLT